MSTDDETTNRPVLIQPAQPQGFWKRLRSNFLSGIVIFAPISITIYLLWIFVDFVDRRVLSALPPGWNPQEYSPIALPGLGLVVFFVFVAALGALTKGFFGRQLFRMGEQLVDRMPVVRSIYTTLKQIVETIFARSGEDNFDQVCLIEYPRKGLWAIAFVTTDTSGEVAERNRAEGDMVSVFLPTTPNPTSGFLLFVPRRDVTLLDMSVEDAAKMVISAGLVTPPYPPPVAVGEAEVASLPLRDRA